jgi:hypothetical protein
MAAHSVVGVQPVLRRQPNPIVVLSDGQKLDDRAVQDALEAAPAGPGEKVSAPQRQVGRW